MGACVSDWELAEREARLQHIAAVYRRGATPKAIREEFQTATEKDIATDINRVQRGRKWST